MPPKSKEQQQAACIALAVKKGKQPKSKLQGTSKRMHENMTKTQLEHYCEEPVQKSKNKKKGK